MFEGCDAMRDECTCSHNCTRNGLEAILESQMILL
jgi:hypothetical protein